MTLQEYFKRAGRGSMVRAARRMGFSYQHVWCVVKGNAPATPFFMQCLHDACPDLAASLTAD